MKKIQHDHITEKKICRACQTGDSLKDWFSLGFQPLANALVSKELDQTREEDFYPLQLVICDACGMVQLKHVVDPEILFGNYPYHSSTSAVFRNHFEEMAQDFVQRALISNGDYLIDIGSNDGVLLKPFKELGVNVLGIEPDKEIAFLAQEEYKIPTLPLFFNWEAVYSAQDRMKGKKAKIVTATNVFAHIDDVDSVLNLIPNVLADDGMFVTEFPYFWEMIKEGTFDLIYHEHLSYFSILPLKVLAARCGWHIVDAEIVPVHGGSLRVYWSQKMGQENARLGGMIQEELRLLNTDLIAEFPRVIKKNRDQLAATCMTLRAQGKRIVGFGCPAKLSTLTNYAGLDTVLIDYVVDDDPHKQGHLTPGVHLPIYPPETLFSNMRMVDYILIFAWNFSDSIMDRCRDKGFKGKFIIPVPKVRFL